MQMDSGIYTASALVIDGNATARSVMSAQLRDLGIKDIRQCLRPKDARPLLEHKHIDIVLCGDDPDREEMGAQDLLDELRRAQLLPFSTVFIMVTSQATYARVAEAAEAALDAYLVRPYTAAALNDRLAQARYRKKILKNIFTAIEAGDLPAAAALCLQRFDARAQFWLYAARIGAELLMRLNRNDEARKLFDAILEARTLPWARLGVARAELGSGNLAAAQHTLEGLIGDLPDFADSYDVMGHLLLETGNVDGALANYQRAASLTPGCLARQQRYGVLAYYAGQRRVAEHQLEKAMSGGLSSKMFDFMNLVFLGLLRHDTKDMRGFKYVHDTLAAELDRNKGSRRLERFEMVFRALRCMLERKTAEALELARWLAVEAQQGDFDLEAGGILLGLWVRLARTEIRAEEFDAIVTRGGLRYCTSKASTEVLACMCDGHATAVAELRACHARIFGLAETAMRHSLHGLPRDGVTLLIQQGEATRNAKLIDMAGLVLKRQMEKIDGAADLQLRIAALQERFVAPLTNPVTPRHHERAAGGMAVPGLSV
ncbi:response regulator [Burkholderiaceae bacterium UC74_6]